MKLSVCFLVFVSTLSRVHSMSRNLDFIRKECMLVRSFSVSAYLGWPYEVKCDVVFSALPYDDDSYYFDGDAPTDCQVWNADGKLLDSFSRTFYYYDEGSHFGEVVTMNGSNDFVVMENLTTEDGNHCFYAELNLTLIEFQQESCEEFVKNFERVEPQPTYLNGYYIWKCEPKSTMLPSFVHSSNITYQFKRSCGETIETKKGDSTFVFPSVQRSDAGDYVCSAIFNGMTRYLSMNTLCVAEKLELTKPVIECEKNELRLKLGQTAMFRCDITIGRGDAQRSDVFVQWKKFQEKRKKFCDSFPKDSHEDQKIVCALGFKSKCSLDATYASNLTEPQVNIIFIIRNITQEDYGNYTFLLMSSPFDSSFFVTLNPNAVDAMKPKTWGIVVAIIIVLIQ